MVFIARKLRAIFTSEIIIAERGTVLPLFGLALFTLLGAVGLAIDFGRAQMVQSKMHAAIDAAALAAAAVSFTRADTPEKLKLEVETFANANFEQTLDGTTNRNYMDTKYKITEAKMSDKGVLTVTAEGKIDTLFMGVFGMQEMDIIANSQVTRGNTGLELVMVLDNSGSMKDDNKRDNMVKAAKQDLLDVLYDPKANFKHLYIGVVPFNHQVNVTKVSQKTDLLLLRDTASSSAALPGEILCTEEDTINRDIKYATTDKVPNKNEPDSLYAINGFVNGKYEEDINDCKRSRWEPGEIQPMQSGRKRVEIALDATRNDGNTRIDIGAVWGWRLLSPDWANIWKNAGPSFTYTAKDNIKAMVLLTDGANCPYNDGKSDCAPASKKQRADDNLAKSCANMKAKGVVVYTIAFDLSNQKTIELLQNCATGKDYYFNVTKNQDIGPVFKKIAESLLTLRISK